ncbi:(2Fe-2S)-binding protein [Actinocrinis puniceicyclus]|uniref:(2Fe-2S)-binding protein n=1 Tax=Actinocrinis puniceicyclus TaxID=977794 RepID=A0A8J7WS58_9ACTN|nr:(2Fe-2S)-binding protein [Actinocrinis puniceicyclus]
MRLTMTLNGRPRTAPDVPAGASLLNALREQFALPGTKNACEEGECGSCTVYLDGEPVCSCLVAAGQAEGRRVRTVEGLAENGVPDAVQRAFVECGAVQCGFCTPGLVVAAHDLVRRALAAPAGGGAPTALDEAAIREALAGNLCRCTGYEKIIDAVFSAAAELRDAELRDTEPRDTEPRDTGQYRDHPQGAVR